MPFQKPFHNYINHQANTSINYRPVHIGDLSALKNSSSAYILCQGPSLCSVPVSYAFDYIGMGLGAFVKVPYRFYFWEPSFVNPFSNWSVAQVILGTNILNLSYAMIYESMYSLLPIRIDECTPSLIIANPRFAKDEYGVTVDLINHDQACLPLYFIDESSEQNICKSLKIFFQNQFHLKSILNLRCTLIRAVCLALALDYNEIHLTGIDPSVNQYWFESPGSEAILDINSSTIPSFLSLSNSLSKISHVKKSHPSSDSGLGLFTYTYSLCFVLQLMFSYYNTIDKTIPKFLYHGSDPAFLHDISLFPLVRRNITILQ